MKKVIPAISFIAYLLLCSGAVNAQEKIKYELVNNVQATRMGEYVVRYIHTLEEHPGYLQSLKADISGKWSIVKTLPLTKVDGRDLLTDFAYAGFENIRFEKNSVVMTLNTFELRGGEYIRECAVQVDEGKFSSLMCDEPKRVEPQN